MKKILSILTFLVVGLMPSWADEGLVTFTVKASFGSSAEGKGPECLVNGVTNDEWKISYLSPAFTAGVVLTATDGRYYKPSKYWFYTGQSVTNQGYHNPSEWTLYGSNDSIVWVPLDYKNDQRLGGDSSAKTSEYTISNSDYYKYFRLSINNIYFPETEFYDRYMVLGEFQMEGEGSDVGPDEAAKWTEVSTAQGFYDAVKADANVKLIADIDVSSLYDKTENNYIFDDFHGRITGENAGGLDFALCGKGDGTDKSLFNNMSTAKISHLYLKDFKIALGDEHQDCAVLSLNPSYCSFDHINVKNCSITGDDMLDAGFIAGCFYSCTFTYCNVARDCSLTGNCRIGGIAGAWSSGSGLIKYCSNAATIKGVKISSYTPSYCIGGIVGAAFGDMYKDAIVGCVNTGHIIGEEETAGITGHSNGNITACVNAGVIDTPTMNERFDYRAGIVGKVEFGTVDYCLNFGSVNWATVATSGAIYGSLYRKAYKGGGFVYYHCQFNGDPWRVDGDDDDKIFNTIASGQYAAIRNEKYGNMFYQAIDNGNEALNPQYKNIPVGIPEVGQIYTNILCDGTSSYSNIYHSSAQHDPVGNGYGNCKFCGKAMNTIPTSISVSNADELRAVAYAVNKGANYSNTTVTLTGDIDMCYSAFTPIGTASHPFMGTFDGNGHRIKNLNINSLREGVGFFGTVAGTNTIIKNVIIDKTCSVNGSSYAGVAGIVGCIKSTSGSTCNVTLQNCGNEADITGGENTAGILGGAYNNDKTVLTIRNCYNAGNITGTLRSATICGYARKNYSISNCYNCGTLAGGTSGSLFYTHASSGTHYVANCYDINGNEGTGVVAVDIAAITDGTLCSKLDSVATDFDYGWKQTVNSDPYPVLNTELTSKTDYLCFTAKEATQIAFSIVGTIDSPATLQYCTASNDWKDYTLGTPISMNADEKILFSANGTNTVFSRDEYNYIHFTSTGKVEASGNIMSLFDKDCKQSKIENSDAFVKLFSGCTTLTSAPKLPATTLPDLCYKYMFEGCTSLTKAPDLPAMSVGSATYSNMFKGCTALTTAPQLPATELYQFSYESMFEGCTALTEAPELPAATLNMDCYKRMFYGCTNLNKVTVYFKSWGVDSKEYTSEWLGSVKSTGTFNCYSILGSKAQNNTSNIPSGWTTRYFDNSITLSNDGYATYSNSVDVAIETSGVKAYKVSVNDGHLSLSELNGYIPSGNGVLLYGPANTEVIFMGTDGTEAANLEGNDLQPTTTQDTPLMDHVDAWVLGSDIEFTKDNATTFTANRAYIPAAGYDFTDDQVLTPDYLCFNHVGESFTYVYLSIKGEISPFPTIQYRINNGDWCDVTKFNLDCLETINANTTIMFRAKSQNSTFSKDLQNYIQFRLSCPSSCSVNASGSIISLLDKNCAQSVIPEYAFNNLFNDCYALTQAPDVNNATLSTGCYAQMFTGCTSLESLPDLSKCTLQTGATDACKEMFLSSYGLRVNDLGFGSEWVIRADGDASNFNDMFKGTGGNFTGTPVKDVTYFVFDKPYTYKRSMANQWGTICMPYAVEPSDDYDLYDIESATSTTLNLKKVEGTLEAGKPAVIRRNGDITEVNIIASSTTKEFASAPKVGSSANGLSLTGAFTSTDITSEDGYIIANNSFWNIASIKGESKVYCSPFHAYLAGTVSSAKMLTIGFGDDTSTAVETINAITTGKAEYYDLNGRKLNDLQQGVNILKFNNGTTKKIIIK